MDNLDWTSESSAMLEMYNYDDDDGCLKMAVEPLMRGKDDKPVTLEAFISSEPTNVDDFLSLIPELGQFAFSPTFKSFLKALITSFVDGSKNGVFMKATLTKIVLNENSELKFFDRSSHFRTLEESINSIKDMVSSLLKTKSVNLRDFMFEVQDFVDKSAYTDYETTAEHPALLQKGEKMNFVLSVERLISNHGLILDDQPSILVGWRSKVAEYDDLSLLLHHNCAQQEPLSTDPDTPSFLRYIRNVYERINQNITNGRSPRKFSPLNTRSKGDTKYKDSDTERVFDILFPRFMCFIHHYGLYRVIEAAR